MKTLNPAVTLEDVTPEKVSLIIDRSNEILAEIFRLQGEKHNGDDAQTVCLAMVTMAAMLMHEVVERLGADQEAAAFKATRGIYESIETAAKRDGVH